MTSAASCVTSAGGTGRSTSPAPCGHRLSASTTAARSSGDYLGTDGINHGYLWEKGRFTTIDVPAATATIIFDVNDRGEMVGGYLGAAGSFHGFFRDRRGGVTTIDSPNLPYTVAVDITNRSQIVGITATESPESGDVHGFVLRKGVKGPFTQIDFPGASATFATGIDDRGRIVGIFAKPDATPSARPTGAGLTGGMPDLWHGLVPLSP